MAVRGLIAMRHVKIQSEWLGHSECGTCPVRSQALFSVLGEQETERIHSKLDELRFASASVVFHQGALPDAVYTLRHGAIKLVRYLPNGDRRIVGVLKPGDLAGLEALSEEPFSCTGITLGAVRACRIPVSLVSSLAAGNEALRRRIFEKYQAALRESGAWLSELAAGSASARVRMARLLLRLRISESGNEVFRFCVEDLGAMLGITVETASRVLASLKRESIVGPAARGQFEFSVDLPALERIASGEAPRLTASPAG